VILDTSDQAAKFVANIQGWVDRHGMFRGNGPQGEAAARYSGCTHRACDECGKPAEKMYTHCRSCREAAAVERHAKREFKEWDGKTPLYCEANDEFFFDGDDIEYFCEENDLTEEDLRLVICEPNYLRQLDPEDWADNLPAEDGEYFFPDEANEALKAFNVILAKQPPVSWRPGKIRTGGVI